MLRSRRQIAWFGLLPVVLAVCAIWLAVDNPTINNTSRGELYSCDAPYDTVLNHADNVPGGEPAPGGDQIAARCVHAGEVRFGQGVATGVAAIILAVLTTALVIRNPRRISGV